MGKPKLVKTKLPATATAGPAKTTPLKPPVTRSKTKRQTVPAKAVAVEAEDVTTAPVEAEYDTDELAELPMDCELEEGSEPGEGEAQIDEQ